MNQHIDRIKGDFVIDACGALSCSSKRKDDFWLVLWRSKPYQLTAPSKVEGGGTKPLPIGSWVCDGLFFDRIAYAPGWFERPLGQNTKTFSLQHVLVPNVEVIAYNKDRDQVPPPQGKLMNPRMAPLYVKQVTRESLDMIKRMEVRLDRLAPYLMNGEEDDQPPKKEKEEDPRAFNHGFIDLDELEPEDKVEDDDVEDVGISKANI